MRSAEEAETSLEVDPPFYEVMERNVYRYISNYYDAGRDERPQAERGGPDNGFTLKGRPAAAGSISPRAGSGGCGYRSR